MKIDQLIEGDYSIMVLSFLLIVIVFLFSIISKIISKIREYFDDISEYFYIKREINKSENIYPYIKLSELLVEKDDVEHEVLQDEYKIYDNESYFYTHINSNNTINEKKIDKYFNEERKNRCLEILKEKYTERSLLRYKQILSDIEKYESIIHSQNYRLRDKIINEKLYWGFWEDWEKADRAWNLFHKKIYG